MRDFPAEFARTGRFRHGMPRDPVVSTDGRRVTFLRSASDMDAATSLWALDLPSGRERLVAEPPTPGPGIGSFTTDRAGRVASFVAAGAGLIADLEEGGDVVRLDVPGPVRHVRVDPVGVRVAYVSSDGVHAGTWDASGKVAGAGPVLLPADPHRPVRGCWWSPDGRFLLVRQDDRSRLPKVRIPGTNGPFAAGGLRVYHRAGGAPATVHLHTVAEDGRRVAYDWDRDAYPYLLDVSWCTGAWPLLAVLSRDQRRLGLLTGDPTTGMTRVHHDESVASGWLELAGGTPRWFRGSLLWVAYRDDARRMLIDGVPVSPPGVQVREVLHVGDEEVLFSAWGTDPAEIHVHRLDARGKAEQLTSGCGVFWATRGGGTTVIGASRPGSPDSLIVLHRRRRWTLTHHPDQPAPPRPELLWLGERRLRCAILLPHRHSPGQPLPVLMLPYAGPRDQRVVATRDAYLEARWLAEQGFAVVIADGRGTPGRGRAWEQAIRDDPAEVILADQVEALFAAKDRHDDLDLDRVGIAGWSFGGYLALLAVLRRPEIFHAAVAGAPVVDWRWYDGYYAERYLGDDPSGADAGRYRAASLLPLPDGAWRPILLIHGTHDQNVPFGHSLALSGSLAAAGWLHYFAPLAGAGHDLSGPAMETAGRLQVDFLRRELLHSPGPEPCVTMPRTKPRVPAGEEG